MRNILKHLWLAMSLILAASVILLMSDLEQRVGHEKESAKSYPSIAVMQIASTTLLDTDIAGVVSRLEERGYRAPDGKNIRFYNPQGDYATANAMARDMVNGPYDIIISSSTVALQVVSKANMTIRKPHVFGAVTDPYGAGVGITGPEPQQHPPYMAGVGSFQPVKRAIEIAREMNPGLGRLGVVWNPGEQCSEACLKIARKTCETMGIELIEANASNTSEVPEALRSVIARNVDAIWIGGDNVAISSINLIIGLAGEAGIPVFTNDPTDTQIGALFGLGADYFTVGQYTGDIVIAFLEGKKLSTFRIENVVPERLTVNRQVLASLKDTWQMTPSVEKLLASQERLPAKPSLVPEPGRTYRLGLSYFVPAPVFDVAIDGFKSRLAELGFVEGHNVEIIERHTNGDMSFLPQATATLVQQHPDILVALSTPCLSSAIAHSEGINIAFAIVSAPVEAGAGKSFDDHLPNVTGIIYLLPTPEVFELAKGLFPRAKRIGVLYNPSEANSAREIELLKDILDQKGLELVKGTVNNVSEIPENIRGLLARDVDIFFAMAVNVVSNGMPAIMKSCKERGTPVIADDISLMGSGAVMSWSPGPYSDGRDLAELTARILLGESPADMPIGPGKKKRLALDLLAMREAGVTPPIDLLKQANAFFNLRSGDQAPADVALVNLEETPASLEAISGVETALSDMKLRQQTDFITTQYCAKGDVSQLSPILDRIEKDPPDVLVTVSTPVLSAAVKRDFDFPLVFTMCSDPEESGLFKAGRPDNICGIYGDLPVGPLHEMVKEHDPGLGDNYFEWGRASGKLVARVLAGVSPAQLPITPIQIHRQMEQREKTVLKPAEPFQLCIVLYSETEFAERCRDGLIDGINLAGYKEGAGYELKVYNAQGDMSTLSSIMSTVKADQVDLLMVVSTPTLQAALRQAGEETRIVFTGVGDGVKAGAGKSETDHLPNVTGISTRSPFDGMARIIKQTLPDTRRVGTIFTPGEINSVLYKDWFKDALQKEGIELVAVPVTSSADVAQSAIELCSKDIQVVAQVVDNLTRPGFPLIANRAKENNLPVFVFDSTQMKDGGIICLARDYYDAGLEAAQKAVRILRGENPKDIPFNNTQSEKLILNLELAKRYKLQISDELMKKATIYKSE
jgi:ABC-type uncharacterized transport system substrate-binding protein